MPNNAPILIISGPTAVGKSRLAMYFAQKWDTEIISADSRQIYKYMDIGTGKPSKREMELVPHHMINIIEPYQTYSAGKYGRNARAILEKIISKGHIPIIVGGTGLYIRSLIDGLAPSPPSDPEVKSILLKKLSEKGINLLHEELSVIDPTTAKRLHPNDRQRILRALEVYLITGKRLSDFQKQNPQQLQHRFLFIFVNRPRDIIYSMINQRIENMFEQGLPNEVKGLLEMGYSTKDPGMQSLGYNYICDHILGRISLTEAKGLMKRDTKRYAKRQITWFKQEKRVFRIECPDNRDILNLTEDIETLYKITSKH